MITKIEIQNYRSFVNAKAELSPFTLVIGSNGAGKSNFLNGLLDVFAFKRVMRAGKPDWSSRNEAVGRQKHFNHLVSQQVIRVANDHQTMTILDGERTGSVFKQVMKFSLNPNRVGGAEQIRPDSTVAWDGEGVIGVLDGLKTGPREDLFDLIEKKMTRFVPGIEKISTRVGKVGHKELQVTERGILAPFPAAVLSEGTKLILIILTIVFQESPPDLILLEDLDRGLHPRLFQRVVETLRDIVKEKGVQIIATTHNPYFLDEFIGDEKSVLIIEKEIAASTITSLADRLEAGESQQGALGELWYGGFVGGVPEIR